MSDGSLKVGVQGLDANRWRLNDILPVLSAYAEFDAIVKQHTGRALPPVDVWGGGQVSQPPRFLGENPFDNLSRMKSVAPHLKLKCIYRGRQGFGFLPCSADIQRLAIIESASRGMQVFRMFDAMHDAGNLSAGIKAVLEFRETQVRNDIPDKDLIWAEGLVFYVSPPSDKPSVWKLDKMLEYALRLAEFGFQEVALADYAEQLTDGQLVARLIEALRNRLDKRGYGKVVVNYFAQGNHPAVLKAALDAGAGTVDVAIGALSGQLSNCNVRDLLCLLMRDRGFELPPSLYEAHPILKSLLAVEKLIDRTARKHIPYRAAISSLPPGILSESRLAHNAVSALKSAIDKAWNTEIRPHIDRSFLTSDGDEVKDAYFSEVLKACEELWVAGGQFHPVSPFGYVCSFQAEQLTRWRLTRGMDLPLNMYRPDFQNIIKGRYGLNTGVINDQCDVAMKSAFHILEVLDYLRTQLKVLNISTVEHIMESLNIADYFYITPANRGEGKLDLRFFKYDERTDVIVRQLDLGHVQSRIRQSNIPGEHLPRLIFATSHLPFPLPNDTLDNGLEIVDSFMAVEELSLLTTTTSGNHLGDKEVDALCALLFKVEGPDQYSVWQNACRFVNSKGKRLYGDIEPDTRPFDKLLDREVSVMADLLAKESILNDAAKVIKDEQVYYRRNRDGLETIRGKERIITARVQEILAAHGYSGGCDTDSLNRAMDCFFYLSRVQAERVRHQLQRMPPAMWAAHPYFDNL